MGVGTKERQLEHRSLSFIIGLLCGLHTPSFHHSLCLPVLFYPASISVFATYFNLFQFLYFFEAYPSHLFFFSLPSLCPFQPRPLFPTLPLPGWLCCHGFWIVSNTADRLTSLTPGRLANKTACHSWTKTTITVCDAKASSHYGPTGQEKGGKKNKKELGRKTERGGLQTCMPSLECSLDHGCL